MIVGVIIVVIICLLFLCFYKDDNSKMIKVTCCYMDCFCGPNSKEEKIILTTEKQIDILAKARRGASRTSYYLVRVHKGDDLIEEFSSDFNIVRHLREAK